ncbi:hypothetical protein P280DRAFT_51060 [Massarina eburnea CBS 473.64]|uniref:Uncharacterized protein n=1 Tax=Massarina eburnea CBS 473.64 TaxID=1395130 RepID=A0A6A6RWE4_9PLEO|nr:hypothetical protein P280DRAFT_51060 [Massarina eburnea CBS 473.64]
MEKRTRFYSSFPSLPMVVSQRKLPSDHPPSLIRASWLVTAMVYRARSQKEKKSLCIPHRTAPLCAFVPIYKPQTPFFQCSPIQKHPYNI